MMGGQGMGTEELVTQEVVELETLLLVLEEQMVGMDMMEVGEREAWEQGKT